MRPLFFITYYGSLRATHTQGPSDPAKSRRILETGKLYVVGYDVMR
jgi:hypothetical protein